MSLLSLSASSRVRVSVTAIFEHENNLSTSVFEAGIANTMRASECIFGNRCWCCDQYSRTKKKSIVIIIFILVNSRRRVQIFFTFTQVQWCRT